MNVISILHDDIFEQISQGGSVEETAENRRIREVADELRRRCRLHEAQSRGGKENVICNCEDAVDYYAQIREIGKKEKCPKFNVGKMDNFSIFAVEKMEEI